MVAEVTDLRASAEPPDTDQDLQGVIAVGPPPRLPLHRFQRNLLCARRAGLTCGRHLGSGAVARVGPGCAFVSALIVAGQSSHEFLWVRVGDRGEEALRPDPAQGRCVAATMSDGHLAFAAAKVSEAVGSIRHDQENATMTTELPQ